MGTEDSKLTNVHQALAAAVQESKDQSREITTVSFKIPLDLKAETEKICAQNGTNMSAFLRKCCLGLVNDYKN